MKKTLKYFSMLLVVALVLTGCGKEKTGENKENKSNNTENVSFEEALKNTVSIKNFKYDISSELALTVNNEVKSKGKTTANGSIDSKGNIHLNAVESTMEDNEPENFNTEIYYDAANKKLYQLDYEDSKEDGTWNVTNEDIDTTSNVDPTKVLEYVKESKKIDSDKDGYDKYEVTIDTLKALNATDESLAEGVALPNLTIYMYVKGKYISFISFDLGKVLSDSFGQLIAEFIDTDTTTPKVDLILKGTVELSGIGEVEEIVVPENVKKDAEDTLKNLDE